MRSVASGPLVRFDAWVRFLTGLVAGLIVTVVTAQFANWLIAVLTGWLGMAVTLLGIAGAVVLRLDSAATAAVSVREDGSRFAADVLLLLACVVSLAAVAGALARAGGLHGLHRFAVILEALVGVVLAWAVVQSVFAFRYAHLYYQQRGGIDFNQESPPDFRDFAYLAVTVGMTFQVADTDITDRVIRHAVARHAVLSWFFGTGIVAVTINVVASLLR